MKIREILYYYSLYMHMNGVRFDADGDDGGQNKNQQQNNQNQPKHHGSGTRLPYGLCKAAGIDVPPGTLPREAWALLEGKTGITAKDVYSKIKEKKNLRDAVKEIKEEKPEVKVPQSVGKSSSDSYEAKKTRLSDIKGRFSNAIRGGSVDDVLAEMDTLEPGTIITKRGIWRDETYVKDNAGNWQKYEYGRKWSADNNDLAERIRTSDVDSIKISDKSITAMDVAERGIKTKEDFKEFKDALLADTILYGDDEGEESRPYSWEELDNVFPKGTVFSSYGRLLVKTDDGYWESRYGYSKSPESMFDSIAKDRVDLDLDLEKPKKDAPDGKEADDKKSKALANDPEKIVKGLKIGDCVDLEIDGKHYRYQRVRGGLSLNSWDVDISTFSSFVGTLDRSGLLKATVYTDRKPTAEERAAKRAEAKARKEAREREKVESTKPYEPSGAVHESPSSLENYDSMMKRVRENIIRDNGLTDDDVEFMENTMKNIFEKYDYLMRFDGKLVDDILGSHFMNQMESGTSHGWHSPEGRRKLSHSLFGSSGRHDDDPDYFEKYGYCDDFESLKGVGSAGLASGYGGVTVKFRKDRVGARTTYTIDDSLGRSSREWAGRAGEKPTFEGLTYCRGVKDTLRWMRDNPDAITPRRISGCYLELQYHGRLTFDDVEEIIIPDPDDPWTEKKDIVSEKAIAGLKAKGIKVYVKGKGYI